MNVPLTHFTQCGHIGRTNASPQAKTQAFIRVAEIRRAPISTTPHRCPDCRKTDENLGNG